MKHIRVVAGAVIRGSQVFLCQRRPDQYPPSAWEFPGGKVEPGESDTEALIRELQEELGCDVAVHEHLGTHEHDYPSFRVTLVLFRVSVVGGELVPREHASVAWMEAADFPGLTWAEADVPLLDSVRACLEG